MFNQLISIVYFYLRPVLKWFLHKCTKLCEIQRICYGKPDGAPRINAVERSLRLTRTTALQDMTRFLDAKVEIENIPDELFSEEIVQHAVYILMRAKRIKPSIHPDFATLFGRCSEMIWGYRQLYWLAEAERCTPYDSSNLSHEKRLYELWDLLMPDERLDRRITKRWQEIGFQVYLYCRNYYL